MPENWSGIEPMGRQLRRSRGGDYLAVGMRFRAGGILAPDPGRGAAGLAPARVPGLPEATLDAALASADQPLLALDLRALPARGEIHDWFRTPQGTWSIGNAYRAAAAKRYLAAIVAPEAFDLLLFVRSVSPSGQLEQQGLSFRGDQRLVAGPGQGQGVAAPQGVVAGALGDPGGAGEHPERHALARDAQHLAGPQHHAVRALLLGAGRSESELVERQGHFLGRHGMPLRPRIQLRGIGRKHSPLTAFRKGPDGPALSR
jgi:hypothetical protein